jgi:hypothetical protein
MCKRDLTSLVIWNCNVQDHGGILCMCTYSRELASQQMEPNLKSWHTMFDEKEIIFAASINSHNMY